MTVDIGSMTDGELAALAERIRQVLEGRAAVRRAREAAIKAVEAYAAAAGCTVAQAWRDLAPDDVIAPDEGAAAPEYQQPTGAHDAYAKGDMVTFQGRVYQSLVDGNVWSPLAYPQGWQMI